MGGNQFNTRIQFFRVGNSCTCIFLTIFFTVHVLLGCSAHENPRVESAALKQRQNLFAQNNPLIEGQVNNYKVIVRMATKADLPKEDYKIWALFPVEGALGIPIGIAAGPMYGTALIVGGIFLIPAGTFGYFYEKKMWESITAAIASTKFTSIVYSQLIKQLADKTMNRKQGSSTIEFVVRFFGIVRKEISNTSCFVISAVYTHTKQGKKINNENLYITLSGKSFDAPPPQCTYLENFSADSGRLLKDTAEEYSRVLAVMVVDRLKEED